MMQEFTQEIKGLISDTFRDMHTALPGRVISFQPDKCEADVMPCGKYKKPDGKMVDYPKLSGVPVFVMQSLGQAATIAFPVRQGDECLLLFAEQALDTWKTGAASNADLRFDLTNAVALIGLFSRPNPLVAEACSSNAIIIELKAASKKDDKRIEISKQGIFVKGNINVKGNVSATGFTLVENERED